jgi:hypothetical protein
LIKAFRIGSTLGNEHHLMKSKSIAIIFLIFSTSGLLAQDRLSIPDKPGTWSYAYLNDENTKMYSRHFGMTTEEVAVFRQKLDNIVNVLHQNPVMASPKGVDPAVESRTFYPNGFEKHSQNYGYIGEFSGITSQVNDSPLYLFNNDYFDRSMSKTAVQLIVIPIDASYFRKESDFTPGDVGFVRINQFLHSLDTAQLVKLID